MTSEGISVSASALTQPLQATTNKTASEVQKQGGDEAKDLIKAAGEAVPNATGNLIDVEA